MEKEQTTIRLPVELKEKLQAEAEKQSQILKAEADKEKRGYTITDLIMFILWKYFQNIAQ